MSKHDVNAAMILDAKFNSIFDEYNVGSYRDDRSLAVITRTLLFERCDHFCASFESVNRASDIHYMQQVNKLRFISCSNLKEDGDKIIACFGEYGYQHTEDSRRVEYFILSNRKKDIIVLFHEEIRSTVVVFDNLTMNEMHTVFCTYKTLLPWYFEEKPLTEYEKKLLYSVTAQDMEEFVKLADQFVVEHDFEGEMLTRVLGEYERFFIDSRIERLKSTVENMSDRERYLVSTINEMTRELRALIAEKRDNCTLLSNLQDGSASVQCGEFVSYIRNNKQINVGSVSRTEMTFAVCTYLSQWDDLYVENCIENKHSILYSGRRDLEDMKLLWDAIFMKDIARVKICAVYRFVFGEGVYGLTSDYSDLYEGANKRGYICNTHISGYACIGGFSTNFHDAIMRGADTEVFDIAVASTGNLNLEDYASHDAIRSIYTDNFSEKILTLRDGTDISPKELIAKIKEGEIQL